MISCLDASRSDSAPCSPSYTSLCGSGLVRDLPGTGSKTSRLGVPDTAKVTSFRAASQPFADKSAPTPSGQKRVVWQRTGRRFARENNISDDTFSAIIPALSRTMRSPPRSLPRPQARIKSALVYNAVQRVTASTALARTVGSVLLPSSDHRSGTAPVSAPRRPLP
ncbi:hypothetical protein SAMN05216597_0086 [Pseudomonas cannabina]|nr:hypothetical protein SAMN05216597_0086 [Pseudomonas cannabina]